jgi:hypothetical protein
MSVCPSIRSSLSPHVTTQFSLFGFSLHFIFKGLWKIFWKNWSLIKISKYRCKFMNIALFYLLWLCSLARSMASSFSRFLYHTQRRATVGRTPVDEWSARRRDLYLTTHNTHNRQTFMPPVGFETTITAGERPLGPALGRRYHSKIQAQIRGI